MAERGGGGGEVTAADGPESEGRGGGGRPCRSCHGPHGGH